MSKSVFPFAAAQDAAATYVHHHLGALAAAAFSLDVFTPDCLDEVQNDWKHAASSHPLKMQRYEAYLQGPLARLRYELQYEPESLYTTPQFALRMNGQLCALTQANAIGRDMLNIAYVVARQDNHALKGHVLACAHTASAAFARASGARGVLYDGPFSPGSVMQVERGAIPVSTEQRNRMWLRQPVYAEAHPHHLPEAERHRPGQSPPPPQISSSYDTAYRRVFGQRYQYLQPTTSAVF